MGAGIILPRRRMANSHPEVEGENSIRMRKLQVFCNGPFVLGTHVRIHSSPRRIRSSRLRVSSSSESWSRVPRALAVTRRLEVGEEGAGRALLHLLLREVPRTAKSEETRQTTSRVAVLRRQTLEERVRVRREANRERPDARCRRRRRPRPEHPALLAWRRRTRACRSAHGGRRSRRRAAGCSRRRGTASAQPPALRRRAS